MWFTERVQQLSDGVFAVHIVISNLEPTQAHIKEFCDYFRLLRALPGQFDFYIDLSQARLSSFVPFVPTIFREARVAGISRCRQAYAKIPQHMHALAQVLDVVSLFRTIAAVQLCS